MIPLIILVGVYLKKYAEVFKKYFMKEDFSQNDFELFANLMIEEK